MATCHNGIMQHLRDPVIQLWKKTFLCLKINILNLHLYFDNIVKIKTELSVFSSWIIYYKRSEALLQTKANWHFHIILSAPLLNLDHCPNAAWYCLTQLLSRLSNNSTIEILVYPKERKAEDKNWNSGSEKHVSSRTPFFAVCTCMQVSLRVSNKSILFP